MFRRFIASAVCFTFIFSNFQYVHAQEFSINQLPMPGTMVGLSSPFAPLALKGLVVDLQKPLEFQFIVDTGKGPQNTTAIKEEANRLVKYFLAGLTIPEGDLWVNLSPYEKDRMAPEALGQTDLGRDLLAQDYILKQLTASLIYPEKDLGKEFWAKVYKKAQEQFGTTNIPVNTFNKVWILPDQAQVFENKNAAYVTKSTLKVMLDEDYLALEKNKRGLSSPKSSVGDPGPGNDKDVNSLGSQIVREVILPEIEKEVNTGTNFAPLRQIYQALILAKWYKETIQNGLLDAVYTNKNKIVGVNLNDPAVKEQIYERYLKAYKKGAFNYIKEDLTPDGQVVPRKYFSGGITKLEPDKIDRSGRRADVKGDGAMLSVKVNLEESKDHAMSSIGHIEPLPKANTYLDELQKSRDIVKVRGDYKKYGEKLNLDEINNRVIKLQAFWSKLKHKGIEYSSGYGMSAVAFVPRDSALYKNLVKLMDALKETKAAKEGKLVFNPKDRLHMTAYALESGKDDQPSQEEANAKAKLLKQQINAMNENNHKMRVVYGKDIFISPKARIGINGYIEEEPLVDLRNRLQRALGHQTNPVKGEHINLASIIKDLSEEELKEIHDVIGQWKGDGLLSGWLNIRNISLIYHANDTLEKTWENEVKVTIPLDEYTKIQMAFQDLIGLTEQDLDNILPGRRDKKYIYNPQTKTFDPLPFEGISVIHNITHQKAEDRSLSKVAQELKKEFDRQIVAFVDLNSFHATTFDLINEPETRKAFAAQKEYSYPEVRIQIGKETREFLKNGDGQGYPAPKLSAKVKITGVGMFAPGIIKLSLEFVEKETKEQFKIFREKLQAFLLSKVGDGYKLVRPELGSLAGHITIGYVMNPPTSSVDVEKFIDVLKQINKKFENGGEYSGIEFELTQGELTQFLDMNHYMPVHDSAMLGQKPHHLSDAELTLLREPDESISEQATLLRKSDSFLTEDEKLTLGLVEENHMLAGPGTDNDHYETELAHVALRAKYDAVLKKIETEAKSRGFISKRVRNDERVKKQIIQIETALGQINEVAQQKAAQVIAYLNEKPSNFKGEEVHILSDTTKKGRVIGRMDRKIAEKFGYVHETANIVVLTPDGKRVVTQLRNKTNYDDHLAMFGGHLTVGEYQENAAVDELKQELGFAEDDKLDSKAVFVDTESYDLQGDPNRERRSWFIYRLSEREWKLMEEKRATAEKVLGISKATPWSEYKAALFDAQNGIVKEKNFSNIGLGAGAVDVLTRLGYLQGPVVAASGATTFELGKKKATLNDLTTSFTKVEAQLILQVLGVFRNGSGEVVGNYLYSFDKIDDAKKATYQHKGDDPARFDGQQVRVLKLEGEASPGAPDVVPLTPDSLDHLLSSGDLWNKIKTKAIGPWKEVMKPGYTVRSEPVRIAHNYDPGLPSEYPEYYDPQSKPVSLEEALSHYEYVDSAMLSDREIENMILEKVWSKVGGPHSFDYEVVEQTEIDKVRELLSQKRDFEVSLVEPTYGPSVEGANPYGTGESIMWQGDLISKGKIFVHSKADSAMLGQKPTVLKSQDLGGIDLNQINVNREGKAVVVQFDPAQLNELMRDGFEGFMPVIINITPIQSPLPLLGIAPLREQESLAKG